MAERERRPAEQLGAEQTDRDEGLDDIVRDHRGLGWHGHGRPLGCPAGCELGEHTCGVGEPIGEAVDWAESAVGYVGTDGPAVTSLRAYAERGAAA